MSGQGTGTDGVVVSELLCFVTNKMRVLPTKEIVQLCLSTFNETDIDEAKKLLFELCADDSTGRYKKRIGAEKDKHNMEDIIKLLNEKGTDIPKFVALDLSKLPPITFDSIDVSALLNALRKTQDELKLMKDSLIASETITKDLKDSVGMINNRVSKMEKKLHDPLGDAIAERTTLENDSPRTSSAPSMTVQSYAAKLKASATTSTANTFIPRPEKRAKPKGVVGTATSRAGAESIRAIRNRLRFANVFATRFDPSVKPDRVKNYLEKNLEGLKDLTVEAVKTKYNTYASFHITAKCTDPSVFMDETIWPEDVFVRWWRTHREPKTAGNFNWNSTKGPANRDLLHEDASTDVERGAEDANPNVEVDGIARDVDDNTSRDAAQNDETSLKLCA